MRQKPLSKTRLHELLALYEGRMVLGEDRGGYDTGMYFTFEGRLKPGSPETSGDGYVGGRIFRRDGFCSEALFITKVEQFGSAGLAHGVTLFLARAAQRRATFERWMEAFYAAG